MNWKLVLISLLISLNSFSQSSLRIYQWEELDSIPSDSVFAIDLSKRKLTELPDLSAFKQLRYLDLGKNKLESLEGLSELVHLKYLNLERNKLDLFPVQICSLRQLDSLVLNRNLFDRIPECIEQLQSLSYLDLWDVPISEIPNSISSLKRLKKLDLSGVRMNPAYQERLKSLLPNTELLLDPPCDCMD